MTTIIEVPGVGEIEFPDSMSDADISAAIAQMQSGTARSPAQNRALAVAAEGFDPVNPADEMSFGQQSLAGAGKWFTDVGLAGRQIAQDINPRTTMSELVTGSDPLRDEAIQKEKDDAALMDSAGGSFGNFAAPLVATLPAASARVLNTLKGSAAFGGLYGALQPTIEAGERAFNTGLGTVLGLAGQYGGNKLSQFVGNKLASRQAQSAATAESNSVRDSVIREATDMDLRIPPASANPNLVNKGLESIAGKQATVQAARRHNDDVVAANVRKQLGIDENTPITKQAIDDIIADEASVNRIIEGAPDNQTDDIALTSLAGVMKANERARRGYPDANPEDGKAIEELVNSVLVDSAPAASTLAMVRSLREQASNAFQQGKTALGRARREVAEILEELMLRNLKANGLDDVAQQFDGARRRMAIAYTAREALDEASGMIDPRKLAARFRKGKPISGEMNTIARTAANFQDAMTLPRGSDASLSNFGASALTGGGVLAAGGNALATLASLGAWPLARGAARATILSGPYQRRMLQPNHSPNVLSTLALQGSRFPARRGGPLAAIAAIQGKDEFGQ